MCSIYLITNDINDKVYVGQTSFSLEKRFTEHCADSMKPSSEARPLYRAMKKYGVEHFHISLIEECPNELVREREIYWIGYYHSYAEGYNATLGGEGKSLFDHDAIANRLKECPYPKQVALEFDCSVDTVYNIAKSKNISVRSASRDGLTSAGIPAKEIAAFTKDGIFVKSFPSTTEAGEWCYTQGLAAALNSGVRSHIAAAANGKRKSAYKHVWKYVSRGLS